MYLDTDIGDMYNSKIPIYQLSVFYFVIPIATVGTSGPNVVGHGPLCTSVTDCRIDTRFQVKAALPIITFRNKKTKFIITVTEEQFCYLNVV